MFLRNEFIKGFCLLLDVLLDRNHTVLSVFDANRKFLWNAAILWRGRHLRGKIPKQGAQKLSQ